MAEVPIPHEKDGWDSMNVGERVGWTLILLGGIFGAASVVTGNPELIIPALPLIGLGLVTKEIGRLLKNSDRNREASVQPAVG